MRPSFVIVTGMRTWKGHNWWHWLFENFEHLKNVTDPNN
jgi:hypothetical protein